VMWGRAAYEAGQWFAHAGAMVSFFASFPVPGKPVHVATEDTDLTAELRRGLSFIRHEKPSKRPPKAKS